MDEFEIYQIEFHFVLTIVTCSGMYSNSICIIILYLLYLSGHLFSGHPGGTTAFFLANRKILLSVLPLAI